MSISELDMTTLRVIYLARVVYKNATAENLERLGVALKKLDDKFALSQLAKRLEHGKINS